MSGYQKLGDWLVQEGILTPEQRDEALRIQSAGNRRLGEVVVSLGYATEKDITRSLAAQYDLPFADLTTIEPTQEALRMVSPAFAVSRLMLPVKVEGNEFHCIMSDPLDIQATDYLSKAIGKKLVLMLAGPIELFDTITKAYNSNSRPAAPKPIPTPPPVQTVAQPKRKIKVKIQDDRNHLLQALSTSAPSPMWDWNEEN